MNNLSKIEDSLLQDLINIVTKGKNQVAVQVNSALTITYWKIGQKINDHILQNQRADYGKEIVVSLSRQLSDKFGRSFNTRNLRRMMQFADEFPDLEIVTTLSSQLSWSHFIELFSLKNHQAKMFYAKKNYRRTFEC
jgi:hypothetical protein